MHFAESFAECSLVSFLLIYNLEPSPVSVNGNLYPKQSKLVTVAMYAGSGIVGNAGTGEAIMGRATRMDP